jgi:O-antigen/teichoic acid export membrane protein
MKAAKPFYRSLSLLIGLNLLVKPLWIFGIDRPVQNIVGHEAYGAYFALLNLTLILNILLDLGITPFLNRSVAAHPEEGPALFLRAARGKLLLAIFYAVIVTAIAWITGIRDLFLLLSLILLQVMTGFNMFFRGYLSASQLYTSDAVVSVTDKFLVIVLAGTLLLFPGTWGPITVERFVWIQVLSLFVSVALAIFLLLRQGRNVSMKDRKSVV